MENNTLFGSVLRTLGYSVTSVGGRVNEAVQPMSASKNWRGPKYDGWYAALSFSPKRLQDLTSQILGTIWLTL
jgi:arylamine N-acetyltransferase